MALDIGGNQIGQGGTLADGSADDATESDILAGRALTNYTPKIPAGQAAALTPFELDEDASSVTQYRVVTVNEDTLTVQAWDGQTAGATFLLARPPRQRQTSYDGVAVTQVYNGETLQGTYTYETPTRRVLEFENGRQIVEEVFPPYNVNDIVYGTQVTNGTGVDNVTLAEVNFDGRKFRPVNYGLRQFVIVGEQFDYWECRPYINGNTDVSGNVVNVAKPHTLRKTPFDVTDIGGAYNGIEYTYAFNGDTLERTAEDTVEEITQTEILIPQVFLEQSIIYAALVEQTDVTVNDADLKLLDINADARYWTRRA